MAVYVIQQYLFNMNLQENIRRILREEYTLPNLIRRRFNEEELYKLVSNVERTFETHRISQQHREDVIDAEVDDFIMNSVYYGEFEDFGDEIYQDIYNQYREPLVNYIKSKLDVNLQEQISRIQEMMDISDMNILDEPLQLCGENPMTGYNRDGYCKTDSSDKGTHTVCSEVDGEFLEFTKSKGNDLSMLKSGDRWCLCAKRWKEAYDEGVAPKVIENATNIKTLDVIGDIIFDTDSSEIEMKEGELTEKCWKGYTQKGMKTMFGKRYPNCVKKTK